MAETDEVMWVTCASCGNASRKHKVLYEKLVNCYEDPHGSPLYDRYHRLVECMGCEAVKYVISDLDTYLRSHGQDVEEEDFRIYPDAPGRTATRRRATISIDEVTDTGGNDISSRGSVEDVSRDR
jgi:hypothetical protein